MIRAVGEGVLSSHWKTLWQLAAFSCCLVGSLSRAQHTCENPTSLFNSAVGIGEVAGGAISTAATDLDHDGLPELVTVATLNSNDPHFRVHAIGEDGVWQSYDVLPPVEIMQRQNRFGGDLMLVDLNGDTFPDILVPESPNGHGAGQLSWFENPANGQLADPWTEHLVGTWDGSSGADRPAHMSEVFAGDLDGDLDIDLVTRDVNNGLHVLIGDGLGQFDRHFLPVNPREGLDLFDPDQDGDLDILINGVWLEAPDPGDGPAEWADLADTDNYTLHPLQSAEADRFWYPSMNNDFTQENYASKVLAVDLNDDGLEDVVISNAEELSDSSTDEKPKGIAIYLADNDQGTAWTEIVPVEAGRKFHTLEAADLDLDGDLDLISGVSLVGQGAESEDVFALLNHDHGTEWTKLPIDDEYLYSGIVVDVDNDGDQDLVGPENWRSGALNFFESNASQLEFARAGDYNCDESVDHEDLTVWAQTFGSTVALALTGADGDGTSLVAGGDFLHWQRQASEQPLLPNSGSEMPEPASCALVALAGASVLLFRVGWRPGER